MPAWIGWLVAGIAGGLAQAMGTLVGRVLVALGLGLAVYTGVSTAVDWLVSLAKTSLSGLPADVVAVAAATKIDVAISMVTSAYGVRMIMDGVTSGAVKRWVHK